MSAAAAEHRAAVGQHELVEAQVRRSPDAPAVVSGEGSLTYAELDARANRLAHHLRGLGVGPEVLVGLCLPRSLPLAVGLLGVLKAGGACVPLDPAYPDERLAFQIGDARVPVVLTTRRLAARLPAGARAVRLDADAGDWDRLPATPPASEVRAEHVAFVIYTSGSTGEPKGVLLTHGGLVDHHRTAADLYALGPADRVLQLCSLGFDASIEEIFPTWAAGATLVLRPDDLPILGRGWLRWLTAQRITVLNLPTAYWHEWVRDLDRSGEVVPDDVRLVVVGGEKARGSALRTWLRVGGRRSRWVNAYGPTETTCMSTVHERAASDEAADGRDPPIGRPLPSTTVRIIDGRGEPVPPGAIGELLLGGAGVARGYLRRPALTADRFVADPAAGEPGARSFRTGDRVRLLASGELDFVGRLDDQVKIRGHRVECGEVAAALAGHPEVHQAVVIAALDARGDLHLVAYVVARGAGVVEVGELRRFLSGRLPEPMVPAAFVSLDALPRTPDGKVDRAALPPPDRRPHATSSDSTRPGSAAEQRVAAIWAGVLGLDVADVGVDDDFFELGGHSLLAAQVVAQVREAFGSDTPLRAIFEAPTVARLAALVAGQDGVGRTADAPEPVTPRPRAPGARFPLSLAQEQMWARELAADPPGLYNVTASCRFEHRADEDALCGALAYLVDRHETLRTRFVVEAEDPAQVVAPSADIDLTVVDLGDLPDAGREQEVRRRTAEQDATPFAPDRAPLVRAQLLHLGEASRLVVTLDHLICDGTSAEIFVAELRAAYGALASGGTPALSPLAVQFADFAAWQRHHVSDEVLTAQLEWWTEALDGMPVGPAVPFDRHPTAPARRVASRRLVVPTDTYSLAHRLARASQSSSFIVCAAAVQSVLSRCGGTTDVVLSTTLSGRHRAELEGLISMFGGVSRIRTDLSGDPTFADTVSRARAAILGMFEHQDIPFLRVRQAVQPDFPTDGVAVAAALPVELGYFHTSGEESAELFFRGQLHPLSVTLLDDGSGLEGEVSYKTDFYDDATAEWLVDALVGVLGAGVRDPSVRLSQLPLPPRPQAS